MRLLLCKFGGGMTGVFVFRVRFDAERVTTLQAAVVIKHDFIEHIAQDDASGDTGDTAQQTADHRTTDTTHRASHRSNDSTGSSTCNCGGVAAINASSSAYHASRLFSVVVPADPGGQALGALFVHGKYLCEWEGRHQ